MPSVPSPRTATGTGVRVCVLKANRGRMVREDRDHAVEAVQDCPEHPVHALDCPDLLLDRAHVPGLVGRLDVAVDEVEPVERGERGPGLPLDSPCRGTRSRRAPRITSSPAYRAIPFSRSTAEIIPPSHPNRSANRGNAGRRPPDQGQMPVAGGFPAAIRARLTGWPAKTSSAAAMHASRRSRSGPVGRWGSTGSPTMSCGGVPRPPAPPGTTRRLRYEIPGTTRTDGTRRLERTRGARPPPRS